MPRLPATCAGHGHHLPRVAGETEGAEGRHIPVVCLTQRYLCWDHFTEHPSSILGGKNPFPAGMTPLVLLRGRVEPYTLETPGMLGAKSPLKVMSVNLLVFYR